MKKNIAMRLASGLMLSCLLSTCVISGTFAKYTTTASSGDTARVAEWGVTVTATGNDAFATKYNDTAAAEGTKVVSSTIENVVAPATNGDLGAYTIAGTPEVMVNIIRTGTITLTGWSVTGDWDANGTPETVDYCPLIFTITKDGIPATYKMGTVAAEGVYTSVNDLQNAINNALTETENNIAANTDLTTVAEDVTITWAWNFVAAGDTFQTDAKDTALGNLASAPKITFSLSVTVEQVN